MFDLLQDISLHGFKMSHDPFYMLSFSCYLIRFLINYFMCVNKHICLVDTTDPLELEPQMAVSHNVVLRANSESPGRAARGLATETFL